MPYERYPYRVVMAGLPVAGFDAAVVAGNTITLRHGVSSDPFFLRWVRTQLREIMVVQRMTAAGQVAGQWTVEGTWPIKYVGPTLSGNTNDVAIETLELAPIGLYILASPRHK